MDKLPTEEINLDLNIDETNKILILQTCSQDEDGQYLVIGAKLKEKI